MTSDSLRRRRIRAIGAMLVGVFVVGCKQQVLVVREVASPAGRYRAVLYTASNEGPLPSCEHKIGVVSQAELFQPGRAEQDAFVAFAVSCNSNVTLEWKSDSVLAVTYTLGNGVTTYQAPTSRDGVVQLTYVARPHGG